jgi:DNA-binding GntR family transcriptional regulator
MMAASPDDTLATAVAGVDSLEPLQSPRASADLIAAQLRERIIDGSFAAGAHVNEAHLAARLDVSRGPVREAVQRLVQEGLLVSHRNRGTSVIDLGPADVADIYHARTAVEREAARLFFDRPTDELVPRLEATLRQLDSALTSELWAEVAAADIRFHSQVVDFAGSARLSKMFSTLAGETLLCVRRHNSHESTSVIRDQHQRLLELIRAGDLATYLEELDIHLTMPVQRLSDALRPQL